KSYAYCVNKSIDHKNEKCHLELIKYCENVISYFKRRIEGNELQIIHKKSKLTVKLYKEKKNHYYPEIISIDVNNLKKNKIISMNFVPYIIYEDIICFFYFIFSIFLIFSIYFLYCSFMIAAITAVKKFIANIDKIVR
ncbi:unnamed protein product, partial [marine sediment metagenome]